MEKISPPVRIFAILIVLVGLGGMLALRMMGPTVDETPIAQPVPRTQPATPAKAAPQPANAAGAPTPAPKAKPKPVVNPVVPPTGFPVVVDKALRKNAIVVVSLTIPGARVDELGAAEAESGARLSGAGFLALNVLNESVARAVLAKLGGSVNASVLVLKRSGEVALALSGFADRETIAQAVANASS